MMLLFRHDHQPCKCVHLLFFMMSDTFLREALFQTFYKRLHLEQVVSKHLS